MSTSPRLSIAGVLLSLLTASIPVAAQIATVGPSGDYPNISQAFASLAGSGEIRVERGTHAIPLVLDPNTSGSVPLFGGTLEITGGWDSSFTQRNPGPDGTVLDLSSQRQLTSLIVREGTLIVDGFSFQTGETSSVVAGIRLNVYSNGKIVFRNNQLRETRVRGPRITNSFATTALIVARSFLNGQIIFDNNLIEDCYTQNFFSVLAATASASSSIELTGNVFRDNNGVITDSTSAAFVFAGVTAFASESARVFLAKNLISGNHLELGNQLPSSPLRSSGLYVATGDQGASMILEGNTITANTTSQDNPPVPQVNLEAFNSVVPIVARSLLISGGEGGGLVARINQPGAGLDLSNLTIVDNAEFGMATEVAQGDNPEDIKLTNSILFRNGLTPGGQETNSIEGITQSHNLIGEDPGFRGPEDYRLDPRTSASVDAGISSPPVGLGTLDASGGPRVFNRRVDLGAFESPLLSEEIPGFSFKAAIATPDGLEPGDPEPCIPGALCFSGALEGRPEVLARIIGPRPNGFLWVQVMRFTPAGFDLEIEQLDFEVTRTYSVAAVGPDDTSLPGFIDKRAFGLEIPPPSANARARDRDFVDSDLHRPTSTPMLVQELFAADLDASSPLRPSIRPLLDGPFSASPAFPDFRFRVEITNDDGVFPGRLEASCLAETVCVSGALGGRTELFLRLIGPRPNGFLWLQATRFTPSRVELDVEQISTGVLRNYSLDAAQLSDLGGLLEGHVDREAFSP